MGFQLVNTLTGSYNENMYHRNVLYWYTYVIVAHRYILLQLLIKHANDQLLYGSIVPQLHEISYTCIAINPITCVLWSLPVSTMPKWCKKMFTLVFVWQSKTINRSTSSLMFTSYNIAIYTYVDHVYLLVIV